MVVALRGPGRVAVAAQVGRHHGVLARELRGDLVPHRVGLREPVQQQDRWSGAAVHGVDRCSAVVAAGVDARRREPFEHVGNLSQLGAAAGEEAAFAPRWW